MVWTRGAHHRHATLMTKIRRQQLLSCSMLHVDVVQRAVCSGPCAAGRVQRAVCSGPTRTFCWLQTKLHPKTAL
ncbi:hypothetical protein EYF80_002042 [Liparis tanakae]|uniref:Uncharacterized protein n=1 Tax=Liparis tanakae TaxID=230148 RepID=A0A4Z2JBJ9_9TELE|nr:hypothetical protein EYF80_002042 [Liparis tanakae]